MSQWDAKKLFEGIVAYENRVGKLYEALSDDVKKQFGPFFDKMAEDEYRHAKIYESLAERALHEKIELVDADEAAYLNTLVESSILKEDNDFIELAKNVKTKFQALDLAERVEREALQYIYELTRVFPSFASDQIKVLLKEEKKHLQMVLDRKKEAEIGFIGL